MKFCISTVVSADKYQWFIPLFSLSARKAYPECGLKVFVKGKLDPELKSKKRMFGDPSLFENQFLGVPDRRSTCNALRHLINPKHYKGYNYIYPTDVDFIITTQ